MELAETLLWMTLACLFREVSVVHLRTAGQCTVKSLYPTGICIEKYHCEGLRLCGSYGFL
jgi:hypothetical protein